MIQVCFVDPELYLKLLEIYCSSVYHPGDFFEFPSLLGDLSLDLKQEITISIGRRAKF